MVAHKITLNASTSQWSKTLGAFAVEDFIKIPVSEYNFVHPLQL